MRAFYALMLAASRYELAIARKYSSNREYISSLAQDVTRWEGELLKYDARQSPT